MIRIALSSVELDITSDLINDLFFLHLEFLTEELETLFTLSKFLNKISSATINMRKITFQFESYTEVITWKSVFDYHMQYAQYAIARIPSLLQNVKFHNVSMLALPSGKASWFTEKLGKRTRRRIFAKIDRGWWIIFPNDSSVTPSLLNAIEIFSLASMRCEVSHKKIVRLRKWITKITFFDDEDGMKREFYFKSNDGEHDPDTKTILTALATNVTYSHSQYYRYMLPWLDDNDLLHDLASLLGGSKVSSLNWVTCSVEVQIAIPEPQTSDDDSDVEAEKDVDESTLGSLFRVLKPKVSNSIGSPSLVSSKGASSRQLRVTSTDENTAHSRFQQVSDRINNQYNDFSSGFFKGRIVLYQDQNCLLFIHENRIVGILNIGRCMEKVFPLKKKKFMSSVPSTPVDSSVYDLQSDDESETSDRDYFEDQQPSEDDRIKNWIIQLIGYDG
ncbi:hypothetical protein EON64_07245 [archaeon]|nr:MAG: hypothetical protein EON64_07245 [archaeon]